jgi:Mn2+/Fe2+ NRAMP family transporter
VHSTVVLCVVLALSALGCSASKRDNSSTARQGAIAGANVGQTKSIIVDPANPRIVFAVTAFVASGLSSTNGGAASGRSARLNTTALVSPRRS